MESPIDLATRMALEIIVRWDIDWNGLALKLGHVAMCFYSSLSATMDEFTWPLSAYRVGGGSIEGTYM